MRLFSNSAFLFFKSSYKFSFPIGTNVSTPNVFLYSRIFRTLFVISFVEISLLLIHGILHLLGYDHAKEDERLIMEKRQQDILQEYGLDKK